MNTLLGRWKMFEDLSRPDRIVCIVLDYVALGFLLLASEILLLAQTWVLLKFFACIFIGIALLCIANYWVVIKPRLKPWAASVISRAANNFWLRLVVGVL